MSNVTLTEDEREALWQASLTYWRSMPWWDAANDEAEFLTGEREVFLAGEGQRIATAVEAIVAARLAAALGEVESRWVTWLAKMNYGTDFKFDVDPPCTVEALADAYVQVTGKEDREAWVWCIRQNTGAFRQVDGKTDLKTTMADYLAVGSPSTVCPRCGRWEGRQMPLCIEPGWSHETACARIFYADDVCAECADAMGEVLGEVGG